MLIRTNSRDLTLRKEWQERREIAERGWPRFWASLKGLGGGLGVGLGIALFVIGLPIIATVIGVAGVAAVILLPALLFAAFYGFKSYQKKKQLDDHEDELKKTFNELINIDLKELDEKIAAAIKHLHEMTSEEQRALEDEALEIYETERENAEAEIIRRVAEKGKATEEEIREEEEKKMHTAIEKRTAANPKLYAYKTLLETTLRSINTIQNATGKDDYQGGHFRYLQERYNKLLTGREYYSAKAPTVLPTMSKNRGFFSTMGRGIKGFFRDLNECRKSKGLGAAVVQFFSKMSDAVGPFATGMGIAMGIGLGIVSAVGLILTATGVGAIVGLPLLGLTAGVTFISAGVGIVAVGLEYNYKTKQVDRIEHLEANNAELKLIVDEVRLNNQALQSQLSAQHTLKVKDEIIEHQDEKLARKDEKIARQKEQLARKDEKLERKREKMRDLRAALAKKPLSEEEAQGLNKGGFFANDAVLQEEAKNSEKAKPDVKEDGENKKPG